MIDETDVGRSDDTTGTTVQDAIAVARLAALDHFEYDRCREAEAQKLGVRVSTLDVQVKSARAAETVPPGQGRALNLREADPWPEPVDGGILRGDRTAAIRQLVIVGLPAARALV